MIHSNLKLILKFLADPSKRIWVLVFSQIIAAPFVIGVLYLDPPFAYYSLVPMYIFGEMWIGVCLSVLVELVPKKLRITGIGVYFFIITNIGGNMQIFVPSVQNYFQKTFDLTTLEAFRGKINNKWQEITWNTINKIFFWFWWLTNQRCSVYIFSRWIYTWFAAFPGYFICS